MTAVLHLDVDAFFASVEQRDDPQLRGRPIAVGAGVVASCSYEARRFGVRTGMRLLDARRLCSQLLVLPGEYPRYEQAARCILAVCQDFTPRVEVAALDDLYLDLAADDGLERRAAVLREQIRDEVRLSVSIGMGANKMVAKAATREAKPGGQSLVAAGAERLYPCARAPCAFCRTPGREFKFVSIVSTFIAWAKSPTCPFPFCADCSAS